MPSRSTRVALALSAACALAVSGCSAAEPEASSRINEVAAASTQPAPSAVASPAVPSPEAASLAPSPQPSAAAPSPAAPKPAAFDVVAVKSSLRDLRYYAGPMSTERGGTLRSAVMAFQKVQGLSADGAIGPATLAALKAPKSPSLRNSAPASRVEVDLTKQVAYVVKGGRIDRILPVSSGNGATYSQKDGSKAKALTPVGTYRIQRRIVGERNADLGTLYDPQYFYRGWAIHGSNSVPARPASHGCVRVTRADAKYLLRAIGIGTTMHIYGGAYTFTAGSGAAGTDAPTGDTAANAPASPKPSPKAPAPKASPKSTPASKAPAPSPAASNAPAPKSPAPKSSGASSPKPA